MMKTFRRLPIYSIVFIFCVINQIAAVNGYAAELNIPASRGTRGEVVKLPVTVDKVENLAGIKLSLTYNKEILKFIKAEKTAFTANMLYVVNDKTPGKLIIAMAAARGFTAEKAPLVEMSFELLRDINKEDNPILWISAAELMSDRLQRIELKFH